MRQPFPRGSLVGICVMYYFYVQVASLVCSRSLKSKDLVIISIAVFSAVSVIMFVGVITHFSFFEAIF